jgi:hypothetical protein
VIHFSVFERHAIMLRRLFLLGLPLIVLLAVASAAQALVLHDTSRLVVYSAQAEPGSHNSQPAKLDPDQISAALARVRARSGESGEAIDLFPKKNREQMAKRLATELRKMEPNQALHLISFRRIGSLLSAQRNATSARVFMEDGRLNFIFGLIDRFYSEFRDPDRPIPPMGSRKQAASLKGKILPAEGLTFVNGRNDWIALDLVPATPPQQPVAAPPAYGTSQQTPMATSPNAVVAPREKTIEEKLQILKNLREKNLITEEEYTAKKKQILDAF